jgi:Mn-dependent DtxR family transcriptional regulator
MSDLKSRILTELSYTDLTHSRLAAILEVRLSEVKEALHELAEAKKVKLIEVDEEKKWRLV